MSWRSLKFIADENIDRAVISHFKKEGYDITDVSEEKLESTADIKIIERGINSNRIIITHDTDFGHIVFTEKIFFYGIIYLQPGHIKSQFTIDSLTHLFNSEVDLIAPFIIIVENKLNEIKIRVRNSI